jgi:hypothetical protein
VRQKGIVFSTNMTTKECADLFRQAAQSSRGLGAMIGEFAAKVAGNDQSGFFTPNFDSPFAGIDGVPDLAVGVHIGKWMNGASGSGTTMHMYVDDGGAHRSVQIVSPHTLTGGMRAAKFVRKFFDLFRAADPNLQVEDDNILSGSQ